MLYFSRFYTMSHSTERSKKNCLNCGTEVAGRFCHNCGQENIEPKQTVWHLVHHFFSDITHFDGKFFKSVYLLFRRPGFLSRQYLLGKRASYLDPVRMYVFTSAVFFLVFFASYNFRSLSGQFDDPLSNYTDSVQLSNSNPDQQNDLRKQQSGVNTDSLLVIENPDDFITKANSVREYDSMQAALPPSSRDGRFRRLIVHRGIEVKHRYGENRRELVAELTDHFLHTLPYILFISLPLYAFFLKLLYLKRKEYYYVDHGIFLIHLYVFTFIFFLVLLGIGKLQQLAHVSGIGWLYTVLFALGVYYAYKAMRNFYVQSRNKTILKFILFNFLCVISIGVLFFGSILITVFRL